MKTRTNNKHFRCTIDGKTYKVAIEVGKNRLHIKELRKSRKKTLTVGLNEVLDLAKGKLPLPMEVPIQMIPPQSNPPSIVPQSEPEKACDTHTLNLNLGMDDTDGPCGCATGSSCISEEEPVSV